MTIFIIFNFSMFVIVSLISGCFSGRFPDLAQAVGGTRLIPHQPAVFYPTSWTHSTLGGPVFSTPLDIRQWLDYYNPNSCHTGHFTGKMASFLPYFPAWCQCKHVLIHRSNCDCCKYYYFNFSLQFGLYLKTLLGKCYIVACVF